MAERSPVLKSVEPREGIKRTYANHITLWQTRNDLCLIFGELLPSAESGVATVEDRVSVTMSWLEAKRALEFLQHYVSAFEEANGPITIPILPRFEISRPSDAEELKVGKGTFSPIRQSN